MKGTVRASELAAAVKAAQSIIWTGTKIDALRHVRLKASVSALEVEATNLDQHIAVSIDASLSDGIAIADPARLLTALQPIAGDASISCTDGFMSLSGKGARSRLALLPADAWVNVERPAVENGFDVDGESLITAFETIAPALADDPSRPYLCGAHLKWVKSDLIAEAANGVLMLTRGVKARRPAIWPEDAVLVPHEFMQAAAKIMKGEGATLSVSANRIVLTTAKGWLASKLIAGKYPDIDQYWDKKAAPALRADRESLLSVVKLAEQFGMDKQRTVVLHEGEALTIGANGETFRASFEGEYIKGQTYSFQPKILSAALSALTSEIVEMTDGGSMPQTIVIHGDGARVCAAVQISPPAWWLREQSKEAA